MLFSKHRKYINVLPVKDRKRRNKVLTFMLFRLYLNNDKKCKHNVIRYYLSVADFLHCKKAFAAIIV